MKLFIKNLSIIIKYTNNFFRTTLNAFESIKYILYILYQTSNQSVGYNCRDNHQSFPYLLFLNLENMDPVAIGCQKIPVVMLHNHHPPRKFRRAEAADLRPISDA